MHAAGPHFAQLYDDYPAMEFIQLEGLGITERGKAADFLRRTDVEAAGDALVGKAVKASMVEVAPGHRLPYFSLSA